MKDEESLIAKSERPAAAKSAASSPIAPFDFTPQVAEKKRLKLRFRAVHFFIAAFIVVAFGAGWFVLNAKSVYVNVQPSIAQVQIEGFSVALGQRRLMLAGDYQVNLSHPGYYEQHIVLHVGQEQAQDFPIQLQELPGLIDLTVDSEDGEIVGALVRANGEIVGRSPLKAIDMAPGTYTFEILADRYLPLQRSVQIKGRRSLNELRFSLSPAWATVSFNSQPIGADVLIDGQFVGTTPTAAQVLQGSHDITLKLAGHKAWQEKIDVAPGNSYDLPIHTLIPADGLVFVRSEPSGANVTVNGVYAGLTPLELTLSPDRAHELALFKNGFEAATRSLETRPNQELDIAVDLTPITSMVNIVVEPAQAQLFIDGTPMGNANQRVELLAADQHIEIRLDGYLPYSTNFTSRPGLEQEMRVRLKSLEQERIDSIRPMITTVTGQSLKLFYPDEFTMGASRREAGRRANEDIRQIKLEKAFYLSSTEVSNGQYKQFRPAHSSGTMQNRTLDLDNQPVVHVTWEDAALYCNWLSEQEGIDPFYTVQEGKVTGFDKEATGYRLPTEAEWEWAARTDGQGGTLRYSWGENLAPPESAGNFADQSVSNFMGQYIASYNDGFAGTAPVGAFQANARGIFDMAGNVSEWVHDFYGTALSLNNRIEVDPVGPAAGAYHVVKGSSWAHSSITELRLSYRDFADLPRNDLGFRIARYVEN